MHDEQQEPPSTGRGAPQAPEDRGVVGEKVLKINRSFGPEGS